MSISSIRSFGIHDQSFRLEHLVETLALHYLWQIKNENLINLILRFKLAINYLACARNTLRGYLQVVVSIAAARNHWLSLVLAFLCVVRESMANS